MKLVNLFESKELVSELLWFQRYISKHDLSTQMEIEDDKIVFFAGDKLIKWDVKEARRVRTEVMAGPAESYFYVMNTKTPFELGEKAIAESAHYAFLYAATVIKGRFKLGEPQISKNANYSQLYATEVIKGRFELGEKVIAKSAPSSYFYASDAIKERFELGEKAIAKSTKYSSLYQKFLKTLK